MIREIRFSDEFDKAFKRLKKKYKSLPNDFKHLLLQLTDNPYQGSELHDNMRKIRLSIASKSKGKRGGGRVIIRLTVNDTCLSFLYIYDKSDMESVSDAYLDDIILKIDRG
ncbi:MAG: addiction module toxin RelE [Prevotella sp.]|nr:addiction module toxin RelE [Prevotella sp.]